MLYLQRRLAQPAPRPFAAVLTSIKTNANHSVVARAVRTGQGKEASTDVVRMLEIFKMECMVRPCSGLTYIDFSFSGRTDSPCPGIAQTADLRLSAALARRVMHSGKSHRAVHDSKRKIWITGQRP